MDLKEHHESQFLGWVFFAVAAYVIVATIAGC